MIQSNSLTAAKDAGVSASSLTIHIIACEFNQPIIDGLMWGAKQAYCQLGGDMQRLVMHRVPGAVEVPLQAQLLLEDDWESGADIDAIVALGAVIKGDTDHYDYVCRMASDGMMKVMLDFSIPIAFGILMVNNSQDAYVRSQQDEYNKGIEAMLAAIKMTHQRPRNDFDNE